MVAGPGEAACASDAGNQAGGRGCTRRDVQETGYELVHHGEGRWNGVAIASRCGIDGVVTNFGEPLRPARTSEAGDDEPMAEARMLAAECGGVRIICVYAPNGRVVGSPFYAAKLVWFDRLARWINEAVTPDTSAVIGGDFNVAPEDIDVWDPPPVMAARTFRNASDRLSGDFRAWDSSMRTDCITRKPGGTRGGTTAPAIFIKTSACASTTCS